MIVIYVEKKSVASSIAKALGAGDFIKKKNLSAQKLGILGYWRFNWNGNDTYIIYGVGHLTALCPAKDYDERYAKWDLNTFPCLPAKFQTKPVEATIDYYNQAKSLFLKADLIISATDSDREGQVVFDYLYRTTGTKTPWKRAWLPSDLTLPKIKNAFDNLENWEKRYPLTLAGIARSMADWTVGINLTVASTLKYGGNTLMNEGRVQTAVLNMVVERTRSIENFKPTPFWKVSAEIQLPSGEMLKAQLLDPEKFNSEADAQALVHHCIQTPTITVIDKNTTTKTIKKPLLLNSSELQISVNKKYGYDVKDIAAAMESLYNAHYISYPRTDAVVVSEAQEKEVRTTIDKLFTSPEYRTLFRPTLEWAPFTKRHFDDELIKKSGDSHTAVIPTTVIPSFQNLSEIEIAVYDTAARSIIALAYDNALIGETTLTFSAGIYRFVAKGSVLLNYEKSWYKVLKNDLNNDLPDLSIGDAFNYTLSINEGETKPPPYYTQATLVKAMINVSNIITDDSVAAYMKSAECGLGTGGTRPEIVGGLLKNRLLEMSKKRIIPTKKGYWLIDHTPNELRMIKDPATTGRWEQMLNTISTSDLNTAKRLTAQFLRKISQATQIYYNAIANSPTDLFIAEGTEHGNSSNVFSCPKCGKPLRKFDWGYGCSGYTDGCTFRIGTYRGKKLTDKQMEKLLSTGKTGAITFKSKNNSSYKGYLFIDSGEVKFDFL